MDSDSEGRQVRPIGGTKGALIGCRNNKRELYRCSDIGSGGFCPANYVVNGCKPQTRICMFLYIDLL